MAAAAIPWFTTGAIILLTAPLWISALMKALNFKDAVQEAKALGLPFPEGAMIVTVALQGAGSLSLIINLWPWLGVMALSIFILAATLLAHRFWQFQAGKRETHLNAFLANMGLIGGLVLAGLITSLSSQ
jgi:putative oxidoreductase